MDLTVEDFQRVLFELYMAQRENNALRAEIAQLRRAQGLNGSNGSHSDGVHSHGDHLVGSAEFGE